LTEIVIVEIDNGSVVGGKSINEVLDPIRKSLGTTSAEPALDGFDIVVIDAASQHFSKVGFIRVKEAVQGRSGLILGSGFHFNKGLDPIRRNIDSKMSWLEKVALRVGADLGFTASNIRRSVLDQRVNDSGTVLGHEFRTGCTEFFWEHSAEFVGQEVINSDVVDGGVANGGTNESGTDFAASSRGESQWIFD